MANNHVNQDIEVSQSTQKLLFAEALVNYILQKYSLQDILFTTELQKKSDVNIFDNNLRIAADFINKISGFETEQTYRFLMDYNLNDISWFDHYATALRTNFLRSASYPESFLHYSVHLAHLAAKLNKDGFKEGPKMAVNYIVEAMDLDLFIAGKAILDLIARKCEENQRLSVEKIEQPSPPRKEKPLMQTTDVQMSTPHEHLTYEVSSSDSFGVLRSYRGESRNVYPQKNHSFDLSEEENRQRKKPRLDHGI